MYTQSGMRLRSLIDKEEEEYLHELEDALKSRGIPLDKASSTAVYYYQVKQSS